MRTSDVFEILRDGQPRTRAQLAESSGLARSTITARVETLMRLGLVVPVGDAVSTGGRPPSLLAFNPAARVVAGVDLGASHARAVVGSAVCGERALISHGDARPEAEQHDHLGTRATWKRALRNGSTVRSPSSANGIARDGWLRARSTRAGRLRARSAGASGAAAATPWDSEWMPEGKEVGNSEAQRIGAGRCFVIRVRARFRC